MYDVTLPRDLQPANQDGEVDEIRLAHPDELLDMIQRDAFTGEAAWVLLAALDARNQLDSQAKARLESLYQAPWALGERGKPGH